MCRGFQQNENELLKIRAFYAQLPASRPNCKKSPLPDYLTLHFLPRINDGLLEINESIVRPDSPAFVTLHCVLSDGFSKYGCRERVATCEGLRFEIYAGDVMVLKGIFRRDEGRNWKMECMVVVEGMRDAKVVVAAAEGVVVKVEMVAARQRQRRMAVELDEIPEMMGEGDEVGSGVCWCSECCGGVGKEADLEEWEMEAGMAWALDVGIWVVCFGVGYLISNKLRGKNLI